MKKLSIIIPVFNEEKTISAVLEKVLANKIDEIEKEIIVVNDGSTDKTKEIIQPFLSKITLLDFSQNFGKGNAIVQGLKKSTGDFVIVQDADLEYDIEDWQKMVLEIKKDKTISAVFGSREMQSQRKGYFHYVFGVRLLTFLINLLFGSKLTDSYTCYKLIKKEVLNKINLNSKGFEIEAEITCKFLKNKEKIIEVPINYFPRKFSQGKHIRAKDGILGILKIIECRIF